MSSHNDHSGHDDHGHGNDGHGNNGQAFGRDQRRLLTEVFGREVFRAADMFYAVDLTALNNSNVSAAALLAYDADESTLTVAISADGLEAGQTHIQHIHGFAGANPADAMVPTLATDDPANGGDNDGFVELAEGATTYGPILLSLTDGMGNFPTATDGTEYFVQTYDLPTSATSSDLGLDITPDLMFREIVIHGQSVPDGAGAGTMGEVNGVGGYIAALPVAAGSIESLNSADGLAALAQFQGVLGSGGGYGGSYGC
ncbi:MAG: hypothetical protein AB7F78_04325 [Hyphomicrobiaceae bacterium]